MRSVELEPLHARWCKVLFRREVEQVAHEIRREASNAPRMDHNGKSVGLAPIV